MDTTVDGGQAHAGRPVSDTLGWELALLLKAHRGLAAARLARIGLHPGQDVFLSALWAQDGLTHSQLAARLRIEQPTVSKMLERLERVGLVRRERDPQDGRVSRVFLTPEGRAVRSEVLACWADLDARMTRRLTAEQVVALRETLRLMREDLGDAAPAS